MKSSSNLVEPQATGFADVVPHNQQRPYRQKIRSLAHVNVDAATRAILRDLSEFGIAMQTVAPLAPNQQVRLLFELPAPRVRIEAAGRIAWTDLWGQAGVQFLDLFVFSCESAPVECNRAEGANELLFSASARPAIRLEPYSTCSSALPEAHPRHLRPLWCPVPISLGALSKLVDGLVVLCSVLLFAVISMALTNVLPTWPVTLALTVGITAVFMVLYWFLFVFWSGTTPGERLARLASFEAGNVRCSGEDPARFR
jgi:hypothetical protein